MYITYLFDMSGSCLHFFDVGGFGEMRGALLKGHNIIRSSNKYLNIKDTPSKCSYYDATYTLTTYLNVPQIDLERSLAYLDCEGNLAL